MIISVIGETDKRPFMYTLLRICQYMGDVLLAPRLTVTING